MDKQTLRKQIRQLKRTFTPEQLCEMSTPITATLLEHPRIKAANTFCYMHHCQTKLTPIA